ncbi:MAG TPA: hypothetical protein VGF08_14085 [Terriglobales bacterium]
MSKKKAVPGPDREETSGRAEKTQDSSTARSRPEPETAAPGTTGENTTGQNGAKVLTTAGAQREIKKAIRAGAVAMVSTAVASPKEANFQLMKYLFELAGIYPAPAAAKRSNEEKDLSLVGMLCRELGLPENPRLTRKADGKMGSEAAESNSVE